MQTARIALVLAALVSGSARSASLIQHPVAGVSSSNPAIRTLILKGPEVAEPSIGIDPADPRRLVVAAMYGLPFEEGGKDIWTWRSDDYGTSWIGERLPPPAIKDEASAFAADVVVGFAEDRAALATWIASGSRGSATGGIYVSREPSGSNEFGAPTRVMTNVRTAETLTVHDKPWMVVDRSATSPFKGSVYVTSSEFALGARLRPDRAVHPPLVFSVSHDNGRSFSAPRSIAEGAFGGYLAVAEDGSVHIVYTQLVWSGGMEGHTSASNAVYYIRSTDGGASFSRPLRLAITGERNWVDMPSVAVRPDGSILACWTQVVKAEEHASQTRCATKIAGQGWTAAATPIIRLGPSATVAWPVVAATKRAWYLLVYLVDSAKTRVTLFRSTRGLHFVKVATLAAVPGLGRDKLCLNASGRCRRAMKNLFPVGDYVSLTSGGGGVAAAYVLPRPGEPPSAGAAAVYVSLYDEARAP